MSLAEKTCIPCKGGVPPLTYDQARTLHAETPLWQLAADASRIERRFQFPNFITTLSFVNQVGALCESEWHHADFSFGWGYCSIVFYTHKIKGLHENDFIIAAKVDQLFDQLPKAE